MDGIRRLGPHDAERFRALRRKGFTPFPPRFRYAPEDEDGVSAAKTGRRLAEQFVAGAWVDGALIEAILDHAAGEVRTVQFTVMDGNPRARLYARPGFVEHGRGPAAVRQGDADLDEILMIKRLA